MKKIFVFAAIVLVPTIAFAADITFFADNIATTIGILVPAASLAVMVAFFYGLAKFLFNTDDEKKREEGKSILLWSILAMFVFVTIYGIIGWMQSTIGNDEGPAAGSVDIIVPSVGF